MESSTVNALIMQSHIEGQDQIITCVTIHKEKAAPP